MLKKKIATAENAWVSISDDENSESIALAKQIISEQIYCTLSTCSAAGMPWGTPLLFVHDEALNLYWSSAIAAQHSQNLYQNAGKAMITIYDAVKIKAVYCAGIATELMNTDQLEKVLQKFDQRAKRPTPRMASDYLNQSPRRMYRFEMKEIWVTGDRLQVADQLIDTKIQLNLEAMRRSS